MRVLDLFSGIGGFSLGLERAGMTTIQFVECNSFCQSVLRCRFPGVPIHDDIKTFLPARGAADVVCGGFPCQPFSTASRGRRVAEDLWPEMRRIINAVRPLWVVAENVDSIDDERPASELEKLSYRVWSLEMDAAPRGRRHERRRSIFVAHAKHARRNHDAPSMQKWPSHRALRREVGLTSPGLWEWMMGFPDGWTECEP